MDRDDKLITLMWLYQTEERWPIRWAFLHNLAFTMNPNAKEFYNFVLENLHYVLPCWQCAEHYEAYVNSHKKPETKEEYIKRWFEVHNYANKNSWKKELTRDEFIDLYFYKKL